MTQKPPKELPAKEIIPDTILIKKRIENKSAKIVVMGNTSVGKTMLIKAFIEGRTQVGNNHYTVTIQDFYKTILVDEEDGV